jgi:c-di-GMP-binding flagellar brake protein YcgR
VNGERLREILPLLRPRSAEPTLFSQTVWYLFLSGLATIVILYLIRWFRLRRRRRWEFEAAAHNAGLSAPQVALLYRIAHRRRMQSPPRLLSSPHVFDRQVGRYAEAIAARDRQHPELAKIGRIRHILGFDEIDLDQSLTSTRQIDRGQTVMIWVDENPDGLEGSLPWLVLERDEGALTLAPVLREGREPQVRLRPGQKLTARFWREGDTEYRFVTVVVAKSRSPHAVTVEHATLERMQHRDFYRIDVNFPADFLVVPLRDELEGGAQDVHIDAAIDLLDRSDTETIRVASSVAVDDVTAEAGAPGSGTDGGDRLAGATRVSGRVVNLSAGGLAVEVPVDGPLAGAETAWIIDPAFEGPFPLAGLTCVPLSTEASIDGRRIKMTFEKLPIPAEKEIVRGVYEHQLQVVGGRGRPSPEAHAPVDDDDLPTS